MKLCAECKNFCTQRTAFLHLPCKPGSKPASDQALLQVAWKGFRRGFEGAQKGDDLSAIPFIYVRSAFI